MSAAKQGVFPRLLCPLLHPCLPTARGQSLSWSDGCSFTDGTSLLRVGPALHTTSLFCVQVGKLSQGKCQKEPLPSTGIPGRAIHVGGSASCGHPGWHNPHGLSLEHWGAPEPHLLPYNALPRVPGQRNGALASHKLPNMLGVGFSSGWCLSQAHVLCCLTLNCEACCFRSPSS